MAGTGSALWYAVLGIAPQEAATPSGTIIAASDNRLLDASAPALLPPMFIAGEARVLVEIPQAAASALGPDEWVIRQVWLPVAASPAPAQPAAIAVETAAVPARAPEPEMVAAQPTPGTAVQTAALPDTTSTDPSGAMQLTSLPAAGDATDETPDANTDLPAKTSDGNGKSPPGYTFVDPYPEKPASGLSSVTTASRAGGAAKGSASPAAKSASSSPQNDGSDAGSGPPGKQDSKGAKGDKGSKDNGKSSGDAGKDKGKDHADKDKGGKGHGDKDNGGKGNGKGSD